MKSLFVLASVMIVLFLTAPNEVEAQKRKVAKIIEGTVIGTDGTKYWSGLRIESGGKEYTFVTEYNARQGTNPTVIGGDCCIKGMRVRVTYIDSPSRFLLNMTRIVVLGMTAPPPSVSGQPVKTEVRAGDAPQYALPMSREKAFFYHVKFQGYDDSFIDYYGFTFDSQNYNNSKSDEFERSKYRDKIRNLIKEGVSKLAFNDKFTATGSGEIGEYDFNASAFPIKSWSWKDNLYVENSAHNQRFLYYFSTSNMYTIINLGDFEAKVRRTNDAANNFIKTRKASNGAIDRSVYLKVTYSLLDKNVSVSANQY
jgi:hypothetical protein